MLIILKYPNMTMNFVEMNIFFQKLRTNRGVIVKHMKNRLLIKLKFKLSNRTSKENIPCLTLIWKAKIFQIMGRNNLNKFNKRNKMWRKITRMGIIQTFCAKNLMEQADYKIINKITLIMIISNSNKKFSVKGIKT